MSKKFIAPFLLNILFISISLPTLAVKLENTDLDSRDTKRRKVCFVNLMLPEPPSSERPQPKSPSLQELLSDQIPHGKKTLNENIDYIELRENYVFFPTNGFSYKQSFTPEMFAEYMEDDSYYRFPIPSRVDKRPMQLMDYITIEKGLKLINYKELTKASRLNYTALLFRTEEGRTRFEKASMLTESPISIAPIKTSPQMKISFLVDQPTDQPPIGLKNPSNLDSFRSLCARYNYANAGLSALETALINKITQKQFVDFMKQKDSLYFFPLLSRKDGEPITQQDCETILENIKSLQILYRLDRTTLFNIAAMKYRAEEALEKFMALHPQVNDVPQNLPSTAETPIESSPKQAGKAPPSPVPSPLQSLLNQRKSSPLEQDEIAVLRLLAGQLIELIAPSNPSQPGGPSHNMLPHHHAEASRGDEMM